MLPIFPKLRNRGVPLRAKKFCSEDLAKFQKIPVVRDGLFLEIIKKVVCLVVHGIPYYGNFLKFG